MPLGAGSRYSRTRKPTTQASNATSVTRMVIAGGLHSRHLTLRSRGPLSPGGRGRGEGRAAAARRGERRWKSPERSSGGRAAAARRGERGWESPERSEGRGVLDVAEHTARHEAVTDL